jgi:hypothetical protein
MSGAPRGSGAGKEEEKGRKVGARPRTHGDCSEAEKRTPAEGGASVAYPATGRSSRAATRRVAGRDKNSDKRKYYPLPSLYMGEEIARTSNTWGDFCKDQ